VGGVTTCIESSLSLVANLALVAGMGWGKWYRVNVMRRLLVLMSVGLLLGCASSTMGTFDAPPSAHDECVYGCENEYSSCIVECEKTHRIGSGLDFCTEQCKATWAECNEDCSKVGNPQ
jgi:hypothetical protein